jgi:hypothetical protein
LILSSLIFHGFQHATIIKTHTVDQRLICWQTKQLGLSLPGCGFGVNVPISINPNPRQAASSNKRCIFIEPCRKTYGILKGYPEDLFLQTLVVKAVQTRSKDLTPEFLPTI